MTYASLPEPRDVLTVGLNHAVTLIEEKGKSSGRGGAKAIREIGMHPDDDKPITAYEGRYGPYVKHGKVNATIPKDRDPAELTLDEAVALITARAAKSGKKPVAKKTPAKKPAGPKKAPAKKKASAKKKVPAKKATDAAADAASD